jgi:hypothetical protein
MEMIVETDIDKSKLSGAMDAVANRLRRRRGAYTSALALKARPNPGVRHLKKGLRPLLSARVA